MKSGLQATLYRRSVWLIGWMDRCIGVLIKKGSAAPSQFITAAWKNSRVLEWKAGQFVFHSFLLHQWWQLKGVTNKQVKRLWPDAPLHPRGSSRPTATGSATPTSAITRGLFFSSYFLRSICYLIYLVMRFSEFFYFMCWNSLFILIFSIHFSCNLHNRGRHNRLGTNIAFVNYLSFIF